MKSKMFLAIIALVPLFFMSCESNSSSEDVLGDATLLESIALEASVDEVEAVVDENVFYGLRFLKFSGFSNKGLRTWIGSFADCASIETAVVAETTTITIGFSEGCEDRRGNLLLGSISIVISNYDLNKSKTITFDNFSINGYVVNGIKTASFLLENTNGNPEMSGTTNITIETEEGTIAKEGTRVVEVTAGGDTDTNSDDEITITGMYKYTNTAGENYAVEITSPLVKPAECAYISQGIKQYTKNDGISTLDYGDGTCDNLLTLTEADGTVTEIEIRRKRKHSKR